MGSEEGRAVCRYRPVVRRGGGDHRQRAFYKVVYDPAQKDGIAFIVPHRDVSKVEIPSFIVSVDQVESESSLDFLSVLPDEMEADIEDDIEAMW